jgi:hypothetical protein
MVLLLIRPTIVLAQYEYDNNCTDSAILDCILDSPEYGNEIYTKLNPDACQECFAATNGPISSCPDATNAVCNNLITLSGLRVFHKIKITCVKRKY